MDNSAKRSKVKLAAEWLAGELSGGARKASELAREAGIVGISKRTLMRAKAELEIQSERKGANWIWQRCQKLGNVANVKGAKKRPSRARKAKGANQECQVIPLAPPPTPPSINPSLEPSLRSGSVVKASGLKIRAIKRTNTARVRETSCSYGGLEAGQPEPQPGLFPSKPEKAPRIAVSDTSAEIGPKGPTWHEMAAERDTERDKQKRNKDPRFQATVELWGEMFREKFGAKYRYFEKDFAQLKRLLRAVPETDAPMSEIERRMQGCFDAFQPWWTKTSCSLGNFCAQWNELVIEPNEVAMQPRYLTEDDRKRIEEMRWLKDQGLAG